MLSNLHIVNNNNNNNTKQSMSECEKIVCDISWFHGKYK